MKSIPKEKKVHNNTRTRPERRWGSRDRLRGKEALCLHKVAHMSPYIISQEVDIKWNDRSIESCTRSRGHTHDPHTQVNRGQGRVGTHTIRTHNPLVNPRGTDTTVIPRAVTQEEPIELLGKASEGEPPSEGAILTGAVGVAVSPTGKKSTQQTNATIKVPGIYT